MIIRIAGEGQYRVSGSVLDTLNQMDNKLVETVERGDTEAFKQGLDALLNAVREQGQRVPDEEIVESDLLLPYADMTLAEARDVFIGDGVIPG